MGWLQQQFKNASEVVRSLPFWMRNEVNKKAELSVTLWPSFPHFNKFANDKSLAGIRMNTAMVNLDSLDDEFNKAKNTNPFDRVPLWFDVKGRQLRVTDVFESKDHLELELNHPIRVRTPVPVLFKAGSDSCLLTEVVNEKRLVFEGGPEWRVKAGESLHIRDQSLEVFGKTFTDFEIKKIEKAVKANIKRYYLSYVECQEDIDEFREMVGDDSEIILKIESKKGLRYVNNHFVKKDNISLMAARGDLYVEVDRPDDIIKALELIIFADPNATVGSRIFLSLVKDTVPECCDFLELAWLYDKGYRKFLLCDEICLKGDLLSNAVSAFNAFRMNYEK